MKFKFIIVVYFKYLIWHFLIITIEEIANKLLIWMYFNLNLCTHYIKFILYFNFILSLSLNIILLSFIAFFFTPIWLFLIVMPWKAANVPFSSFFLQVFLFFFIICAIRKQYYSWSFIYWRVGTSLGLYGSYLARNSIIWCIYVCV